MNEIFSFIVSNWANIIGALGSITAALLALTVAFRPLVFLLKGLSKITPVAWDDHAVAVFEKTLDAIYNALTKVAGVKK